MLTLVEQLIAVMKKRAEDISKLDPTLGGYAWRKINYLGDNPTLQTVMMAASDIVLLSEKVGLHSILTAETFETDSEVKE